MTDPGPTRRNERLKAISGVLFNVATALSIAAIVKVYADSRFSIESGAWLFTAGVVMWVGWLVLGLLEVDG